MSCNGEGVRPAIDTTNELIDELSSSAEEERLIMDAGSINCDRDSFVDDLSTCEDGERLIMDEAAINCDTNFLSVINGSTYTEETNNRINTNCHLHRWHIQSATENLYTLTKFQPCNHASFCEICACKVLLCPVCDKIIYGTVKMTCRIVQ